MACSRDDFDMTPGKVLHGATGRKRLEDLVEGQQLPRIAVVPVTDDAPTLYETWVGMGGEGSCSRNRRRSIVLANDSRPG
jgi:hypothetical protein